MRKVGVRPGTPPAAVVMGPEARVEITTTLYEDVYQGERRTGRQRAIEVRVSLLESQVEAWRSRKLGDGYDVGRLHVKFLN